MSGYIRCSASGVVGPARGLQGGPEKTGRGRSRIYSSLVRQIQWEAGFGEGQGQTGWSIILPFLHLECKNW